MKKLLSIPTIYTICALLYLAVGHWLNEITVLTLLTHGVYVVLTVYYTFCAIRDYRSNLFIKALLLVFILFLVYSTIFLVTGVDGSWKTMGYSPFGFLESHFNCIAPIFVYYYFGAKGMVNERWFQYMGVLFLVVVFSQYIFKQQTMLELGSEIDEITNNAGYYWLSILPIVIFYRRKPIVSYVLMAFISIMCIACLKRGAIVILAIVDIYIMFKLLGSASKRSKYTIILISFVALFVLSEYVQYLFETNYYAISRLEDTRNGYSSGRDVLYKECFEFFLTPNSFLNFIFGNGALGTVHYLGRVAHNDWLEIAINMGLVGIVIYLYYWIANYKIYKVAKMFSNNDTIIMVIGAILISNFLKTWFSMSINDMQIYSDAMLGYCLSKVYGSDIITNS